MNKPHETLVIAHRGASAELHENTLPAFRRAAEQGAEMLEFDIRRTRDRVFACHHDPSLAGRVLCECDYAELSELTVTDQWSVPTLEEVLALAEEFPHLRFDIELKEPGYEKEVLEAVLPRLALDRFFLSSFYDDVLKRVKDLHPEVGVGLILGLEHPWWSPKARLRDLFPMPRAKECGAGYLVISRALLPLGILNNVWRFRGQVYVWTVNRPSQIRSLALNRRVNGIITDYPALAGEIIRRPSSSSPL